MRVQPTEAQRRHLDAMDRGDVLVVQVDDDRARFSWLDETPGHFRFPPLEWSPHWATAMALWRRGWITTTRNPDGVLTGRFVITSKGRRALAVARWQEGRRMKVAPDRMTEVRSQDTGGGVICEFATHEPSGLRIVLGDEAIAAYVDEDAENDDRYLAMIDWRGEVHTCGEGTDKDRERATLLLRNIVEDIADLWSVGIGQVLSLAYEDVS